jgi:hypothetical protein
MCLIYIAEWGDRRVSKFLKACWGEAFVFSLGYKYSMILVFFVLNLSTQHFKFRKLLGSREILIQIFIFQIYQKNPHQDGAPVIILEGASIWKFFFLFFKDLTNFEKIILSKILQLKFLLPKIVQPKILWPKSLLLTILLRTFCSSLPSSLQDPTSTFWSKIFFWFYKILY